MGPCGYRTILSKDKNGINIAMCALINQVINWEHSFAPVEHYCEACEKQYPLEANRAKSEVVKILVGCAASAFISEGPLWRQKNLPVLANNAGIDKVFALLATRVSREMILACLERAVINGELPEKATELWEASLAIKPA